MASNDRVNQVYSIAMRFFVALALLVLGVAVAHHTPEHQLHYPRFIRDKTHLYDVTINMTSGVPGMSPQVSKAVIQAELKIYAKSEKELLLQMHKVRVSNSLAAVESATEQVPLVSDRQLEEHLSNPMSVILENGAIKSYTLSPRESLESQKIKRSVLRNLELYLETDQLSEGSRSSWPLTYNLTRNSPAGNYKSHYVVTSSPFPDFPKDLNVFNISRTDDFEVLPYLAYKTHHNFAKQGCPEVCTKEHIENRFGAGCPIQQEPYHTPLKRSFVQHHNLRMIQNNVLIIDSVRTKETHVADVYDQNMEIDITSFMQFTKAVSQKIPEPQNQQIHTDLNDYDKDVNEEEIEQLCKYPDSAAAISKINELLRQVVEIVLKDNLAEEESKQVGEMLVTLQKALQTLKKADLRTVQRDIINHDQVQSAPIKDKVKRQIWIDLLPTIGSSESVSFIVQLISENMNSQNKQLSLWEAKTILEDLPQNVHLPTEKTIRELSHLLESLKDRKTPGYSIFHSASHIAVARIINRLCANASEIPEEDYNDINSFNYLRSQRSEESLFKNNMLRECPKVAAKKFIDQLASKLQTTNDKTKRIIYIEALSRTGLEDVLPILQPYVYGQSAQTSRSSRDLTQSYTDYLKTVTIHALHNVVRKSPRPVQEILLPVFLNKTEPPKVRTAAFSVLIKSQPTLGLLQQIAEQSWYEPSEEVASHVASTLETYGNSSIPCNQLTALRIKKVLPQLKRVDHGQQKAKNLLFDLWDDVRGFGLEQRLEFTPSNESFIPSVMYASLGYNTDTLKDYLFQLAYNVQGLTSRTVYDTLLKRLGLQPAEDIPKRSEDNIFPNMRIVSRDPEPWRITAYESLFYSTSYYHFDGEESTHEELLNMLVEQVKQYISRDSEGNYAGQLIKVYIPSSYHAKTVGQSLPYPIQFEMKNPLLVSMKLKVKPTTRGSSLRGFELHLHPSVYHSTVYTHEILNLGDCKKVGVHHVQRTAASYPVTIEAQLEQNGNLTLGYKFPDLPKNILSYRSEAGTHASKSDLQPLPTGEDKKTIKTLPSQFKKSISWGILGLPKFVGEIKSEDIQFGLEDTPRNPEEAAQIVFRRLLNAGWRRQSVDISRVPDNRIWALNTEVKMRLNYSSEFVTRDSSESDWSQDLSFEDHLERDEKSYAEEGQKIAQKFARSLSHIKRVLKVRVEQRIRSTILRKADMNLEHSQTLGGYLHLVHLNASATMPKTYAPVAISADYAVAFVRRPNEFKYSEQHGKQRGLALAAVSFERSAPFQNPSAIAKAVFKYKPLDQVLAMDPPVESKHFEPETHEECMDDVRQGKSLSVACIKAIREKSIYNNIKLHAIWLKESPELIKNLTHKIDLALKHVFYSNMEVTKKQHEQGRKQLRLEATYIDQMTDKPVIDLVLEKPTEILNFSKISAGPLRPLSSIETIPESLLALLSNNTYPATCTMMDKYIMTYDLKTYPLPRDTAECTYVLSTHCTEQKKFAVIVKYTPQAPGTQEIHIHLGKDEVVLVPGSKWSHKVQWNKREMSVKPLEPLRLSERAQITASVNVANDGSSFIEINARKAGLQVRYDGVRVKVQVHPRYKGELCGMCSEFNGEVFREFRGVDRCLYTNAEDFVKSSSLGSCVDKKPKHSYMCNNDEVSYSWPQPMRQESEDQLGQEEYEPTSKRNMVLSRQGQICFSTKAVPVCEDNAQPQRTQSQELDFHCLPRSDKNARKLLTEAKRRILGELETKSIDRSEEVEVAQMC